jgi:hypothetical protein
VAAGKGNWPLAVPEALHGIGIALALTGLGLCSHQSIKRRKGAFVLFFPPLSRLLIFSSQESDILYETTAHFSIKVSPTVFITPPVL